MTEENIRKYFLGEMGKAEAETLEESLFYDKNLFSQAEMIENEIIDDYLQNRLSESARNSFEKNYPITEDRRVKIKSSKEFFRAVQETPSELIIAETKSSFWYSVFESYQFSKIFAFGAAAAVIITVAVISIWLNRQNKQEIAGQQNTTQTPVTGNENKILQNVSIANSNIGNTSNIKLPEPSNEPVKTPKITPSPDTKSSPPIKIEEKTKPIFASFTLLPGVLRAGGEQTIKISSQTNKVILRLALPENAVKYETYRAIVKTVDGQTIFASSNLTSINLIIPADKFRNETYVIFLEGIPASKPAESVAEYIFRADR